MGFLSLSNCAAQSPSTSWENLAHCFSRSLVLLLLLLIDVISRHLCLQFCVLYFTHRSNSANFRNKSRSFVHKFLHSLLSSSGSLPATGHSPTLYRIVVIPSVTVLSCLMLCNADSTFSHNLELLAEQKETRNKSCISGTSFSEIHFLVVVCQ